MEFADACMSGNLEQAKRYYNDTNYKQTELYMGLYNWSFYKAIQYRQLEVAKWLVQVEPDLNITAKFDGYDAFLMVCRNNNLPAAKWLLELRPHLISSYNNSDDVNPNRCDNYCFNCNDMDVVFTAKNNSAFDIAVSFKSADVAMWLQNQISKELKWKKRKLALFSHFNGKQNDLLFDLPFDLVRNICDFI